MAKAELFWSPLGWFTRGGGAFPVRRGERDTTAIETAVRLCREGHIVVMFPEGTRRLKGLSKRHEARARTGAARIALEAGVPLVPAGISGTDQLPRLAGLRVAYGPPVPIDDLRGRDAARGAPGGDRPADAGDRRAGGVGLVRPLLAVDGDSFAHRAFHALPSSFRRDRRPPGTRWSAS